MAPMINQSLSRNVLRALVKPAGTGVTAVVGNLDYNKALGNVTAFYRSAIGNNSGEVQIPLPPSDKPTRPRGEGGLTDVEIEEPLVPLFNYLNENLRVLDSSLSETAKEMIINRVWKEILLVLEGLLIPPLSDVPSDLKPLSEKEVDIVFKWLKVYAALTDEEICLILLFLQFLRDYFYDGGEGFPLESLQNQKYRDVVSIRLYYDWHT
jgi:hypothetical protein